MQFDRHFGNTQRGGDFFVAKPLGHHPQHFHFADTQGTMQPAFSQLGSYDRIHILTTLVNFTHGAEKFLAEDADSYQLERNGKRITDDINMVMAGDWIVRVMEEEEQ